MVDKLGVKPGAAVQFDDAAWPLDDHLKAEILARAGRPCAEQGEQADVGRQLAAVHGPGEGERSRAVVIMKESVLVRHGRL